MVSSGPLYSPCNLMLYLLYFILFLMYMYGQTLMNKKFKLYSESVFIDISVIHYYNYYKEKK